MPERHPVRVSSAEFVRRFGSWQDRAATEPVVVTHHGRPRLVLLSSNRYQQMIEAGADDGADGSAALRLATLLDRLDSGFVAFDRDLRVTAVNAVAASYFRLRRDAAIGPAAAGDMPDLLSGPARTQMLRTLASGEVGVFEAPSVAYPGEWIRLQSFPFDDGVGMLFRNVSSERMLRTMAAAEAALAAALAAHGAVGIGMLGPRGLFTRGDATLAAMTGRSGEALHALRLGDLIADEGRASADAAADAVLGGGGARAFDSVLDTPDGPRRARIALAPVRGDYVIESVCVVMTAGG